MKNIHAHRIHCINDSAFNKQGDYILYWMSLSFREHWNYSLEYALGLAEQFSEKLLVVINLEPTQKRFTERHIRFLLEGIIDLEQDLRKRKIKLVFRVEHLKDTLTELSGNAVAIITDFPYLKEDKERLFSAQRVVDIPVIAIEGNVIVPVEAASNKPEYAARTIRSKLMNQYEDYLVKPRSSKVPISSLRMNIKSDDFTQIDEIISELRFSEHTNQIESDYKGGYSAAHEKLNNFLNDKLSVYDDLRQSPTKPAVSQMSMYLAMGMIAPAYIVSRLHRKTITKHVESYLEELIVRRELAYNFVYYTSNYDSIQALPGWALDTLSQHKEDVREYTYTRKEFESAETHDEPWNECMRRMKSNGYLHNHMRMYWGKQILAWSNTPNYAHQTLLYLNNKYFLDGNDPNSYANALWVFGLHDRAWQENKVFGKVRIMNRNGLDRKIDVEKFVERSGQSIV